MKSIDFRHFKVFTGIDKEKTEEHDVSRQIADTLYTRANGIVAHDLALRIYREDKPTQLNDEELSFLRDFFRNGTPVFYDSFEANLKDE